VKDADGDVGVEVMSPPPTAEGACPMKCHSLLRTRSNFTFFVRDVFHRDRWRKKDVREIYGENLNSWTKRVASRTLEGLEGYDAATQV
jgi:hypothetical protein